MTVGSFGSGDLASITVAIHFHVDTACGDLPVRVSWFAC
jgi:hypothetical protein